MIPACSKAASQISSFPVRDPVWEAAAEAPASHCQSWTKESAQLEFWGQVVLRAGLLADSPCSHSTDRRRGELGEFVQVSRGAGETKIPPSLFIIDHQEEARSQGPLRSRDPSYRGDETA